MKNSGSISLISQNDTRVTHAAVLLRPDKDPVYLVAKGRPGTPPPAGFEFYDEALHHREHSGGKLCCGNCLEAEGKEVVVHHRDATAPRIAGGDQPGSRATFAANPRTVDDHTEYCKSRRTEGRSGEIQGDVKFHFNLEIFYEGATPPKRIYAEKFDEAKRRVRILEPHDARLSDRQPLAISKDISEYRTHASRLTKAQAHDAIYVIDGVVRTHDAFVDNDSWKNLYETMSHTAKNPQPARIFHLSNPRSIPRRDFANAASGLPELIITVPQRSFEFSRAGEKIILQPVIVTNNPDVKAMLETAGDFLVVARFKPSVSFVRKDAQGVTTRGCRFEIQVDHPSQLVRLYEEGRRIKDLNMMEHLHHPANDVTSSRPKMPVSRARPQTPAPGQASLFDGPAANPF